MKEKIEKDLIEAVKKRDKEKVSFLRYLLAQIHNLEIEKKGKLTEDDLNALFLKEKKKREEAISQFKRAKREDLVKVEEKQLSFLKKYLPEFLSEKEIEKMAKEVIKNTGAKGEKDFSKVMGVLMKKIKKRAEGRVVAQIVKKVLKSF